MAFYRIVFVLPSEEKAKTTYVRAEDEERAMLKLYDRYKGESAVPRIRAVEVAEGEFITD